MRALRTLFYKMNNDLMTINETEQRRRVSSFLKGLIERQRPSFLLAKKILIGINPPYRFVCLPVQYCYFKTFCQQLPTSDAQYSLS